MIKIIFFDIDGTLRPFETGRVPETTQAALRRAHEAGILCAIATGRHWMEIRNENLAEGMRFDAFVTMDGEFCYVLDSKKVDAAIARGEHLRHDQPSCFDMRQLDAPLAYFDPQNGRVVQRIEIPKSAVQKVIELCEEQSFACLFEEERAIYANRLTPQLLQVLKDIKSAKPPVRPMSEALENPIYMMIPVMPYEEAAELERRVPECAIVRWSDGLSFDLTKKGITKVSGIDAILKAYGFTRDEAAAIGDGWNDVEMIEHCGLGIAMGNAKPECKAVADYICPSILEGGIPDAIDYILARNREG
ncbi:MAG TPA: haloacid dehalogenase [Oribacterium sp.]|nr:haloacid dehalogenase [Oribacterium sp.]